MLHTSSLKRERLYACLYLCVSVCEQLSRIYKEPFIIVVFGTENKDLRREEGWFLIVYPLEFFDFF